jgi:hypothetical protein
MAFLSEISALDIRWQTIRDQQDMIEYLKKKKPFAQKTLGMQRDRCLCTNQKLLSHWIHGFDDLGNAPSNTPSQH